MNISNLAKHSCYLPYIICEHENTLYVYIKIGLNVKNTPHIMEPISGGVGVVTGISKERIQEINSLMKIASEAAEKKE